VNNLPPTTEELLASLNQALPFSDEAEKGVLSCLLQYPLRCEEAPPPEMFHHEQNRTVAAIIVTLYGANKPVDPISITHALRDRGLLDKVGGAVAISELFAFCPIPSHFPYYSAIVREKFSFRQMIGALAAGIAHLQAFQGINDETAADALQHCQKLVCEAVNDDGSSELKYQPIKELLMQVVDDSQAMAESGKSIPGITTGIPGIDAICGGFEDGCLTVVAAESSDGKSSLCRQMIEAVAEEGHCAIDFTYEMMPKTEARRMLCSQGRIDANSLKMGLLTKGEQNALEAKAARIMGWDIHIIDVAGKTIEQICRHIARKSKRLPKGKKIVALIDYIQLCKTSAVSKSREREIAHITSTAKQCAKMTGAHIIMPSQQNKEGEVRESMAIEQDADTLIQIQKIEVKSTKKAWEKTEEDNKPNNIRRIFFKKLRDGERYTFVTMELVGRFFRFEPVREPETEAAA
jgi:replicative DNA helicase